jgi:hypothetical protein
MPAGLPSLDPIPLPAPAWLLSVLLLLTFFLHVLPMSVTLGGGFWAIVAASRSRDPAYRELARRIGKGLPYWTAATVTTGVAALLFLQVLYGPVFYASSIVTAWPWLSIVGLVLAGYYGYYVRSHRLEKNPAAALAAGAVAWLAFAAVAFLYVNEMTLMLHPERLLPLYVANRSGATLGLGEPTLAARYLHMVVGAIALAALWVAWLGARTSGDAGRRVAAFGLEGFAAAAAFQVILGGWLLAALPRPTVRAFMGAQAPATVSLLLSVVATLTAVSIAWRARRGEAPGRPIVAAAGHVVVVIALMVLMRDVVRRVTLGEAARIGAMQVAPQWGMIAAFLAVLLAGLATVAWMVVATRRASPARGER